jgi:hypothetical protein
MFAACMRCGVGVCMGERRRRDKLEEKRKRNG